MGICHVVSFTVRSNSPNTQKHTQTHSTCFRGFGVSSSELTAQRAALSSSRSLVACFRGMEFTVQERAREEGAWMEWKAARRYSPPSAGSGEVLVEKVEERSERRVWGLHWCFAPLSACCEATGNRLCCLGRAAFGLSRIFWTLFQKMDYLTDPAVITPVLVVAVHLLTAAGFWYYFRPPPALEPGTFQGEILQNDLPPPSL